MIMTRMKFLREHAKEHGFKEVLDKITRRVHNRADIDGWWHITDVVDEIIRQYEDVAGETGLDDLQLQASY